MDACVGKIVELLADGVINYVKRHGAYVIRYKNKAQLLEQENKQLGERKDSIQRMVDSAENNGKVIEIQVSSWLKDAENMEGAIASFLRQENRESFKCFKCCMCPNLMWRHKRGMEAEKRKSEVSELIRKGAQRETLPVAHNVQWEPLFDSPHYYTTFSSRDSVFAKIMNALKDLRFNMIGVLGPGGAGKTTMVKEVAKEAKKLGIFVKIVIVVVSKDSDTSKLQDDLASELNLNYGQTNKIGRADELRKALSNGKRKILVILDDLWQELDLNAIGIPISGPGRESCKILLTSRREEVFTQMEVCLHFSIGYLKEQEAWELFTKVTGGVGVDESLARNVCERGGGLPLAIVIIGAALKGKKEDEWLNALIELKKPLKYIEGFNRVGYTPLKWSYDFLKDDDAKSCFLLCCLFPEDVEISIDELVRYSFALGFLGVETLKEARIRVRAKVNKLKSSCLLLNGERENFVKMHDVIRDLAISITGRNQAEHDGGHDWASQQQFMVNHNTPQWPKNNAWKHHTAISLRINDGISYFPSSVLHCPLMQTLVLKLGKSSPKIPNDFFQGMEAAKILDLEDIVLDLPSLVLELDHLQMLRLNNCQLLGDLATIQNLKNHIEILSFEGSTIEELPQEIGELTCLRSLVLRECNCLKVIPKGVISNLIHLEELYVTNCFMGWDTTIDGGGMSNASIVELKSLTQLTVLYVGISPESCWIMVLECPNLFEKLIDFVIILNNHPFGNSFQSERLIDSSQYYATVRPSASDNEIMNALKRKSDISEPMRRVEGLRRSPVTRDASFQSEPVEGLRRSPVTRDASFQSEPLFDSPYYYTTFSSRASIFAKIMNALKDFRFDMIGVHGPGGAGKTTMVKEVAKEAKKLGIFDKIVIADVSKDPNTAKLQEELAIQLDLNYERTSESGRADELRKALLNGKRKILVILDDLWQVLDLNEFGIPISGLGDGGCKILLTSRREEVFKRMEVRLYFPIGYLEEQEAWELFTKVTGDFGVSESIARKVCKRCGGLPIAILAVGAELKGEEEVVWLDALHKLENCPLEGICPKDYTPVKWSYDLIDEEEDAKSCFLLCCLFPEDAEISIDDLVNYSFALGFLRKVDTLKAARCRVQAMVNMLRRSCLLLNGKNENFVKMHDVIRDFAISITNEKQTEYGCGHDWPGQQQFIIDHNFRKWPENDAWKHHTAISLRTNYGNIHFPCGVLHCPLMHTVVLKLGKSSPKIPNDFFQGMKEARVLDLEDIVLDLPSLVLELDYLRMLRLKNCQLLGDLTTIRNLKKCIEILCFEGSTVEKLPQEIGELTRLRSLNLKECNRLKVIPKDVISNLIHLQELYVTGNFKEWDTYVDGGGISNASIAELKSLTQLTVLHVSISAKSLRIMVQECSGLFSQLINFNIIISKGWGIFM